MVKAKKTHKRIAVMRGYSQSEIDFAPIIKKHPIYPYGKPSLEQKFYPKLMREAKTPKQIGQNDEMESFILSTIRKGLRLLSKIILNNNLNYVELKAIAGIITAYMPANDRNLNELESPKLWSKFIRFLSRSNRRTSMYRLTQACQKLGNEMSGTTEDCDALIKKIYNLIRGDTGKICCNADRNEWENSLESKPLKFFVVGDRLHDKL
jgi:hypothetical protein